ncbi:hypothetical protein [Halioxenophilus sp. WMMB6]|uniref:hypothetical protein n=1 Tax=Halioxenophilus sp. WMMB6 TaxID=3073815 RepID=UPI00295E985C|nr:hypothetical protein [Halioxenophilus sp. WMMB6]
MLEARTGNKITCPSADAVRLYQTGVDLLLGSESGAGETLDRALALDGNFALAAAARYCVAKDIGEPNAVRFREQALAALAVASDWERQHCELLIGLVDQPAAVRKAVEAYVAKQPADLLIIAQLVGYLFFFDGPQKLTSVLALLESVEAALTNDWAFLARLGFAASEAGQHQRGRAALERALAIRPQSLYTIHGLAHLLHDEGAAIASAELLQGWLQHYGSGASSGQMYGHVQWHLALAEFQVGNREAAIERYLHYCAPATTTCGPILTLADCGGFLLRDYLQTGLVKPLPNDVAQHIECVWGMMGHPFVALHVAGLYASAGDLDGLQRCQLEAASKPEGAHRRVSLRLISALTDLVLGRYAQVGQTLSELSASDRIGIGGSNVERILVDLIERHCEAQN